MKELKELTRGEWFEYNGSIYRKGEECEYSKDELIVYGVSANAYVCAKLYKNTKVNTMIANHPKLTNLDVSRETK